MAVLTEEQTMLRDAARGWINEYAPVSVFRKQRDAGTLNNAAHYKDMAQMGWTGILIPEEHGGADFGLTAMALVIEEMGRQLVASPLISSAVTAASAIRTMGNADQQAAYLPGIADGSRIMTLAVDEGPHHDIRKTAMTATPDADGYVLNGVKTHVPDGQIADTLLVLARTDGAPGDTTGLSLFAVPADSVSSTPLNTLDKRDHTRITFASLRLGSEALIGPLNHAYQPMEHVLDIARVALAAEMLGLCNQAFDTTLDYLKTRKQFDTILAHFQAVQHRMADLFCNMELVRSTVEHATRTLDAAQDDALSVNGTANREDATEAAILTKSMANDFANLMSRQMVQLHGGIGMTDLHDAGLYLKRARALEAQYGNTAWQNERFAQLKGY